MNRPIVLTAALVVLAYACATEKAKQAKEPSPDVIATLPGESRNVFIARSSLDYIKKVASVTNCVIKNEDFLKEVESFPKYTFTTKTPKEVADSLRNMKTVTLSTFQTKNPFSAAIASTINGTVYFNTRRNPRTMNEMLNTSIHEGLHVNGYSHGDNFPKGKEDSVNYRVGMIAEKYLSKCSR
jgi:hypothetical protein